MTFTDPEVASVGLPEAQARQAGLAVRVGVTPMAATARGWIHGPGAERGVIKPVAALRELVYPYPTFVRGVEDALRRL